MKTTEIYLTSHPLQLSITLLTIILAAIANHDAIRKRAVTQPLYEVILIITILVNIGWTLANWAACHAEQIVLQAAQTHQIMAIQQVNSQVYSFTLKPNQTAPKSILNIPVSQKNLPKNREIQLTINQIHNMESWSKKHPALMKNAEKINLETKKI